MPRARPVLSSVVRMSTPLQIVALVASTLAVNGLVWAVIVPVISAKGRRQVEQYGAVPESWAHEPAEHEGRAHYLGTLVDDRKYYAKGYFARSGGPAVLTEHAFVVHRGVGQPMLVPRDGIRGVERRSRFAGKGALGKRITVIHWEMGGGRFETGVVFLGGEEARGEWEDVLDGRVRGW